MSRFPPPEVLLQENPFGVINMAQPGARVLNRFAENGVNRTGRRTQRILDHKWMRMPLENILCLEAVRGHVRFREWDGEPLAQLVREFPLPFNPHSFPDRRKNRYVQSKQFIFPGGLSPID